MFLVIMSVLIGVLDLGCVAEWCRSYWMVDDVRRDSHALASGDGQVTLLTVEFELDTATQFTSYRFDHLASFAEQAKLFGRPDAIRYWGGFGIAQGTYVCPVVWISMPKVSGTPIMLVHIGQLSLVLQRLLFLLFGDFASVGGIIGEDSRWR